MVRKHLKTLQTQKDTEDFAAQLYGCVEQVHFMKPHPLRLCKHIASSPEDNLQSSSSICIKVPK